MNRVQVSLLGSGTTPYTHPNDDWHIPHQDETSNDIVYRDGIPTIVINPEDWSADGSGFTQQVSVTTSAIKLDSGKEYRRAVAIANIDSSTIVYIGFSSSVTASNGFPIFPRSSISIDAKSEFEIYGITSAGTVTIAVMEISNNT